MGRATTHFVSWLRNLSELQNLDEPAANQILFEVDGVAGSCVARKLTNVSKESLNSSIVIYK